MVTRAGTLSPKLYAPNPHWSDRVNCNIIRSEIEGGVHLRDLLRGAVLEIETQDWICTLEYCGDNEAWVSGHPEFCPEPVRVYVAGSTWGGSMIKQFYIGRGMYLEFLHPVYQRILTSLIVDIREVRM
jgi:hypothetical protein